MDTLPLTEASGTPPSSSTFLSSPSTSPEKNNNEVPSSFPPSSSSSSIIVPPIPALTKDTSVASPPLSSSASFPAFSVSSLPVPIDAYLSHHHNNTVLPLSSSTVIAVSSASSISFTPTTVVNPSSSSSVTIANSYPGITPSNNDEDDMEDLMIEDGRDTVLSPQNSNGTTPSIPLLGPRTRSNYYYVTEDDDSKVLVDTLRFQLDYENEIDDGNDMDETVLLGLEEEQGYIPHKNNHSSNHPNSSSSSTHYVVNTDTPLPISVVNDTNITTGTPKLVNSSMNVNYTIAPEGGKYNTYDQVRIMNSTMNHATSSSNGSIVENSTGSSSYGEENNNHNDNNGATATNLRTRQTHVSFGTSSGNPTTNTISNNSNLSVPFKSLSSLPDVSSSSSPSLKSDTNTSTNNNKFLVNYRQSRVGTLLNSIPETGPVLYNPTRDTENSSAPKGGSLLPPLAAHSHSKMPTNSAHENPFSNSNNTSSSNSSVPTPSSVQGGTGAEGRFGLGLGFGLQLPQDIKLGYGTVMMSTYHENNNSKYHSGGYGSQYFDDAGGVTNDLVNRINQAAQGMGTTMTPSVTANTINNTLNITNRSINMNQYTAATMNPSMDASSFLFGRLDASGNTIQNNNGNSSSGSVFHRSSTGPFNTNSSFIGGGLGLKLDFLGGTALSDEAVTTPSHTFSEVTSDSDNSEQIHLDSQADSTRSRSSFPSPLVNPILTTSSSVALTALPKMQTFTINSNFSKSLVAINPAIINTDMPNTLRTLDRTSMEEIPNKTVTSTVTAPFLMHQNSSKKKLSVMPTKNGSLILNGFVVRDEGITQVPAEIDYDDMTSTMITRKNKRETIRQHFGLALKDTCVRIGVLGKGASGCVYKVVHIPTFTILAAKTIPIFVKEKLHRVDRELRALFQNRSQGTVKATNNPEKMSKVPNNENAKPLPSSAATVVPTPNNATNTVIDISTFFATSAPCPYLIRFYDAFYSPRDDQLVFVTEYMDGGSLQDIIDRPKGVNGIQSESVLANISWRILKGLEYLHQHHMIHRDIKPSNLLINHYGEVKIADFGILQHLKPGQEYARTFTGTTSYMSPERLLGNTYTYNCDIWSAGLSILACTIGRSPFHSSAGYWNILQLLQNEELPLPPADKFSDTFRDFLQQCLQKDPAKRPSATVLLQHPFVRNCNSAKIHMARMKGIPVPHPAGKKNSNQPPNRKLGKGIMHDLVDLVKKIQEYRFEAAIRKGHAKIPNISKERIHNLAEQLDIPDEIIEYMFKTSQEKLEQKLYAIREKVIQDRKQTKNG